VGLSKTYNVDKQVHSNWTLECTAGFNDVLPTQLYLCVLCGSQNKQRLFPYTALTDWFL
jgi:hypothetical protein